eukprot:scaffold2751_cov154-Chaetoceros_neogracile.AAC.4
MKTRSDATVIIIDDGTQELRFFNTGIRDAIVALRKSGANATSSYCHQIFNCVFCGSSGSTTFRVYPDIASIDYLRVKLESFMLTEHSHSTKMK